MNAITIRSKNDVIRFVNNHPEGSRRARIIVWIALGSIFIDAYDFTSLSIGLDSLKAEFLPTAFELGLLSSSIAIGALFGALIGGRLVDRMGRYKLLILDLMLFVVAAIGAALSPSIIWLVVFRFLLGVGVGIDMPAALSLVAEFSRSTDKGKYLNFWQLIWYCATVTSAMLTLPIIHWAGGEELWRWAVGIGAVPALILLTLRLIYADESPLWAAHNLGVQEAVDILRRNYSETFVLEQDDSPQEKLAGATRAIFTPKYRMRTLLASVISGGQAMQYFAVAFYLPIIIGSILGQNIVDLVFGIAIINVFGLLGGGTQPFLTQRFGMRRLAIVGCTICIVALVCVGLLSAHAPIYVVALVLGIFIFGHSFGPGSQGKSIAALSYPTQLRGVGTGWAEAMSRVGSILGLFIFPLVIGALGVSNTMLLLIFVPLGMLVTLLLVKWEPVGQEVENLHTATDPS